jgi:hypothetical protein
MTDHHDELQATLANITAPGKGILAADESTPTMNTLLPVKSSVCGIGGVSGKKFAG